MSARWASVAAAIALGLVACDADEGLVVRAVVLESPALADPLDVEGPFALAGESDCAACPIRAVSLVGGDVVRVRLRDAPALELDRDAIAAIELVDEGARPEADPALVRLAVHAIVDDEDHAAWEAFAARHARDLLLVEFDGRAVDLVRPLGATRTIRIGIFDSQAARAAYVATLPFRLRPTSETRPEENDEQAVEPDQRNRPERLTGHDARKTLPQPTGERCAPSRRPGSPRVRSAA